MIRVIFTTIECTFAAKNEPSRMQKSYKIKNKINKIKIFRNKIIISIGHTKH